MSFEQIEKFQCLIKGFHMVSSEPIFSIDWGHGGSVECIQNSIYNAHILN